MRPSRREKRPAKVAILVVLSLTVLVGTGAIALDGGMAFGERRHAQATADAAALAAAEDLFANSRINAGMDLSGTAYRSAMSTAAANGYSNDGTTSVVTVKVPGQAPVYTLPTQFTLNGNLKPGYVEVTVQYNQSRLFSAIWGQDTFPIKAHAVARGLWQTSNPGTGAPPGILVLNPSGNATFTDKGNALITDSTGTVIVNSNGAQALTLTGNSSVSGSTVYLSGSPGYQINGGNGQLVGTQGGIQSGVSPTADPFAYLFGTSTNPKPPSGLSPQTVPSGNSPTLQPGIYTGGLSFSGQGTVTLQPGIYWMKNGGFSLTGQAGLNAQGVMIYSDGAIDLEGQGDISISPPTTGIYQGISLVEAPSFTGTAKIAGQGQVNITGSIYVPNGTLQVVGNGTVQTPNIVGTQIVTYDLAVSGNGVIKVQTPNGSGSGGTGVGNERFVGLVQ
jgi:hypothetical protein